MTNPFRPTGKQRFDEHIHAYRMASWCPVECDYCGWRMDGILEHTRAAFREHRATAHPELPKPRTRIQLRAGGWQTGAKRIDENIENARKVGAGRNTT